jgi:uncharacterized protein (TIGR02145 family)
MTGVFFGVAASCDRASDVPALQVQTLTVTDADYTSFTARGEIISGGGAQVTRYGFCWSVVKGPMLYDDTCSELAPLIQSGGYESDITGLQQNTIYFIRAYAEHAGGAVNATGTGYGEEVKFRTNSHPVTDIDGNTYPTVAIGSQVWMAANLRVTHFPDGNRISIFPERRDWDSLRVTDPSFAYYNNSQPSARTYGALYNWAAAVYYPELVPGTWPIQGVCPDGWHLPDDQEWMTLEAHLGMDQADILAEGWRGAARAAC